MLKIAHPILFVIIVCCIGCSSSGDNPVADELSPNSENEHVLWGTWNVQFNVDALRVEILPSRDVNAHFNLTSRITPVIQINSWDSVLEIIDVDVTITNPYLINGYDVRTIIYTDPVGHKLTNADDWTELYDIPDGDVKNPFKAYAKSEPNRIFAAQTEHTENLLIHLPNGNPDVSFAIDASYPGNCEDPYEISGFSHEILLDEIDASTTASVTVKDWQDDISGVYIYCPDVMGLSLHPFEPAESDLWKTTLINLEGASEGEYPGFIYTYSGGVFLFDEITVTVSLGDS